MKSITLRNTTELCSKCRGRMIVKGHRPDDIHIKKQKQYFTEWNYCIECRTQWFDPKNLVINDNRKTDIQEYYNDMNSLFKNI
jgi:hypothetical protein